MRRVTPSDNAIATWGGVKKWLAIADNESLLICHPLDITEATITRNGNDAANAAADLNQRRRIEEKLNLGGKDPRAWVGMADQLAPSEKTEQAAYRDEVLPAGRILGFAPELGPDGAGTRDGQIADSVSPVMREVSGVTSGSGQMVNPAKLSSFNKTTEGVTAKTEVLENGLYKYTFSGINTGDPIYSVVTSNNQIAINNGHKILFFGIDNAPSGTRFQVKHGGSADVYNSIKTGIIALPSTGNAVLRWNFRIDRVGTDLGEGIEYIPLILDLTTLPQLPTTFVASLTSSDAHRVAHALGFLALQRD